MAGQLAKQLREGADRGQQGAGAAARGAALAAALAPAALQRQAAAAWGGSFVEWCRGLNVVPFPQD